MDVPNFASVLLAGADEASVASLQPAAEVLESFGIHAATALEAGTRAIIVASPDAALPAALAAQTDLPVIRVPTNGGGKSGAALLNDGADNLPGGPSEAAFATMAIGAAGAKNAALFVVSMLAREDERLRQAWADFRAAQTDAVLRHAPLTLEDGAVSSPARAL